LFIFQEIAYIVSAASLLLNNFGEKNGNVFVICGVTCGPIKIQLSIDKAKFEKLKIETIGNMHGEM